MMKLLKKNLQVQFRCTELSQLALSYLNQQEETGKEPTGPEPQPKMNGEQLDVFLPIDFRVARYFNDEITELFCASNNKALIYLQI